MKSSPQLIADKGKIVILANKFKKTLEEKEDNITDNVIDFNSIKEQKDLNKNVVEIINSGVDGYTAGDKVLLYGDFINPYISAAYFDGDDIYLFIPSSYIAGKIG